MYGVYDQIISAAERALESFDETAELLEYPEVQADKAYYLSVLSKYNHLNGLKDKLSLLKAALNDERAAASLLQEAKDFDREAIYQEISAQKKLAARLSAELSDALGCKHVSERAYCRLKLKGAASRIGAELFALIRTNLKAVGAKIEDEKESASEISFIADGADVIARLTPLSGAHKVYSSQVTCELCFAVTPSAREGKLSEKDIKIDLFRSSGAGGQHINKTESAVRVTHIPTGLSVVCQDERSQIQNKKRALCSLEKKLSDITEQSEKDRMEADIRAQYSVKNTPLSFDAETRTMTDTRLKAFTKTPFPLADEQFTSYINGLMHCDKN